jgi:hypothetical protein
VFRVTAFGEKGASSAVFNHYSIPLQTPPEDDYAFRVDILLECDAG